MGDKLVKIPLELLRARYDFKASRPKTLTFSKGDYFLLHSTGVTEKNWWQVINCYGQMGYVPSNYVACVKVSAKSFREFIECCLENLNVSDDEGSVMSQSSIGKDEMMRRLIEKKRQVDLCYEEERSSHQTKSSNSYPTKGQGEGKLCTSEKILYSSNANNKKKDNLRSVKSETTNGKNAEKMQKATSSPELNRSQCTVGVQRKLSEDPVAAYQPVAIYKIVDSVRQSTDLSYKLAKVAVSTVVSELQDLLPGAVTHHLQGVLWHTESALEVPNSVLLQTFDAKRLSVIFGELNACKQDEQQRSWMLHEDEGIIVEYITELIQILTDADIKICHLIMCQDNYDCVINLIQYYQMEFRWSIRNLLLKSFGVMCNLDLTALKVMLCSVLPLEIVRDMHANPKDVQRLRFSVILLTMLFSMAERMPFTHFEHISMDFVKFLLRVMHSPPEADVEERLPDLFLNCILAYNLQFNINESENYVVDALEEFTIMSTFTDKILLLLNREDDPIRVFKHEPAPDHSVLKLFIDIFGRPSGAQLFYTNDVRALIDIIVRQLSDLSPGDRKRPRYLELIRRIIRNANYAEHMHRRDDLSRIFTRIFCEEEQESKPDQQLVREISNEFPQYFKA